jgi:hypothetical protein
MEFAHKSSVSGELRVLREGDAKVFKKYSQLQLQMKREALAKLNRRAHEGGQGFDLNGGRAGTRTPGLLRVNSSVVGYIADSYSGLTSFLRLLCVSPALIAQHSEQRFAGRWYPVNKCS